MSTEIVIPVNVLKDVVQTATMSRTDRTVVQRAPNVVHLGVSLETGTNNVVHRNSWSATTTRTDAASLATDPVQQVRCIIVY